MAYHGVFYRRIDIFEGLCHKRTAQMMLVNAGRGIDIVERKETYEKQRSGDRAKLFIEKIESAKKERPNNPEKTLRAVTQQGGFCMQ